VWYRSLLLSQGPVSTSICSRWRQNSLATAAGRHLFFFRYFYHQLPGVKSLFPPSPLDTQVTPVWDWRRVNGPRWNRLSAGLFWLPELPDSQAVSPSRGCIQALRQARPLPMFGSITCGWTGLCQKAQLSNVWLCTGIDALNLVLSAPRAVGTTGSDEQKFLLDLFCSTCFCEKKSWVANFMNIRWTVLVTDTRLRTDGRTDGHKAVAT